MNAHELALLVADGLEVVLDETDPETTVTEHGSSLVVQVPDQPWQYVITVERRFE